MNASDLEIMRRLEDTHWWYRGLRDLLGRTLRTPRFTLPESPVILDAGCGTGANLRLLRDEFKSAYLGGFDLSPDSVRLTQSRGIDADVYVSDICAPELRASKFDLVLCCDVVSIAGIQPAENGLRRLADALKSGGLFIFNMPAFEWLSSSHDAAIGTRDRVTTARFAGVLGDLGLEIALLTYRVSAMFPLIVAARLPSVLRGNGRRAASDLRPVPGWRNALLSQVLFAENEALVRGVSFPWGSSVYAVAKKR